METNDRYGWNSTGTNLDTHLMKNIEWGAVAYLTQSSYGINGDIGINNYYNSGYRTGCGAASGSSASTTCNVYDETGVVASTTGNIYGVYDMSGGVYEYVSAYVDNSYADDYGSSITNLTGNDVKYKDIYDVGTFDTTAENYNASINHKGDAVYETSGVSEDDNWHGDFAYMPRTNYPWFLRGGCNFYVATLSGVFNFDADSGDDYGHVSFGFRPVVLVGAGL